MINRRKFIKHLGTGIISAIPISAVSKNSTLFGTSVDSNYDDENNFVKIGIIGAESSHSYNFAKKFNVEKSYPGVEVSHIWGETNEFAKISAEKGKIPNIVKNQHDMMGKINALIVDHRHGKYHLKAARPFVEVGLGLIYPISKYVSFSENEHERFVKLKIPSGEEQIHYIYGAWRKGFISPTAPNLENMEKDVERLAKQLNVPITIDIQ